MLPDIEKFYKELGQKIKIERSKRDISQKRLGDHLELTRASIINLEKGRHRPSIYQVLQIAILFQIEYTELIPHSLQKARKRSKDFSKALDNVITDQTKLDKSSRAAVTDFLSTLQNPNP